MPQNSDSDRNAQLAMLADCARSGLTPDVVLKLYYQIVLPDRMAAIKGVEIFTFPGYSIPITGPDAKVRAFRYRILFPLGDSYSDRDKYFQPLSQPNYLCYANVLIGGRSWEEILAEKKDKTPIVIVEGEKKGAALCLAGIPAIAVTGVWSWLQGAKRNDTDGWILPPRSHRAIDDLVELLKVSKDRTLILLFDSDITAKPSEVRRSMPWRASA